MVKFSCEKALLQQAVSTVSRAVATKSSIPALEGILLECEDVLRLSGYNMQTGIRTTLDGDISEKGRIVLNARLFGEMIRRLPDDMVVFDADGKFNVHLTCGDASFELPGLSADDYPELPEVDDQFSVTLEQRTLKAMIQQTSFAVSVNETRPIHTGALFEINDRGLTMVAVDGFRLALRREPLESLDRVSVVISEKLKSPVRCVFSDDRVYMSARTGNGEAKDICPVRGDGQSLEIGFNNRYLMDALRYAPADTVTMQLNTGISPCIIVPTDGGDNFLYMVLPVRLKAQ